MYGAIDVPLPKELPKTDESHARSRNNTTPERGCEFIETQYPRGYDEPDSDNNLGSR